MRIKTEKLKDIAQTILSAVDSNKLSMVTETLELLAYNSSLRMNVTNREYYVQVGIDIDCVEDFHATVDANTFLKLISQLTTEYIDITVKDNKCIQIKSNGTYKLPLIFDSDELLKLPEININNVISEFYIDGDILNNILIYNSSQLNLGTISKPVQKMYYMDEHGAITFTNGACINDFTLDNPIKLLFNTKLVKLFKLFKGKRVKFSVGQDTISESMTQTKVRFEVDNMVLTAILFCDGSMINSVPVDTIRNMCKSDYDHEININKQSIMAILNRLMLFVSPSLNLADSCGKFILDGNNLIISDINENIKESIECNVVNSYNDFSYSFVIDITDLKPALANCVGETINLKCGNSKSIVIGYDNIHYIIPEVQIR